ncbi:hypothetical protein K402DRAFT_397320, partial [Aulographum hederae CBS 113979]
MANFPFLERIETENSSEEIEENRFLDEMAQDFTSNILQAAQDSIPQAKQGAIAKPWWTPELKDLRTDMMKQQRASRSARSIQDPRGYADARNRY